MDTQKKKEEGTSCTWHITAIRLAIANATEYTRKDKSKTYLVLMAVAILLVFLAAQTIMERIERRGAPAARGAVTVVVHTRRGC